MAVVLKEVEEKNVILDELEVRGTELAFVTASDKTNQTFFAQLSKFTYEELDSLNQDIADYCNRILEARNREPGLAVPGSVKEGDVYCARYPRDGCWYRARILSFNEDQRSCTIMFVDYGNKESTALDGLVQVDPDKLPSIKRAPFGITCSLMDPAQYVGDEQLELLFDCLSQHYVMIKVLERQTEHQWKVGIPKHGYNLPFWNQLKPGFLANERHSKSGHKKITRIVCDLTAPSTARAE